jgi:hypothetical protein
MGQYSQTPSLALRTHSSDEVYVCRNVYKKMEQKPTKKIAKLWITTIAYLSVYYN